MFLRRTDTFFSHQLPSATPFFEGDAAGLEEAFLLRAVVEGEHNKESTTAEVVRY
jgi:hypothetical protein